MSELNIRHLEGLLTKKEFVDRIRQVASQADTTGEEAGFYVQKHHPKSIILNVSGLQLHEDEMKYGRAHGLLGANPPQEVEVYVTGRKSVDNRRAAVMPRVEDLAEFQELYEANHKLIRGFAATRQLLGGTALFLMRESESQLFAPEELEEYDQAFDLRTQESMLEDAGLNWTVFRYPGSATKAVPVIGEPGLLFV